MLTREEAAVGLNGDGTAAAEAIEARTATPIVRVKETMMIILGIELERMTDERLD
jgi:hypothetical protein